MQSYSVHLLFHALTLLCGAALGVAGTLWWSTGIVSAGWAALAALLLGIAVLVLQWRHITASAPRPDAHRASTPARGPRPGTRPELGATAVQRYDDPTRAVSPPTRRG